MYGECGQHEWINGEFQERTRNYRIEPNGNDKN